VRLGLELTFFVVIYFLSGWFGMSVISLQPENVTPLWLPSGISLVMWLRYGWITAPIELLVDFAVNLKGILGGTGHSPYFATFLTALYDTGQGYIAWMLLNRFIRLGLREVRDLLIFGLFVCILPSVLSGFAISYSLFMTGYIEENEVLSLVRSLSLSDGLGILLIYPLYESRAETKPCSSQTFWMATFGVLCVATFEALGFTISHGMLYFILPIMLGLTLILSLRSVSLILLVLIISIFFLTANHLGPFYAETSVMDGYFSMMAFVFALSIAVLTVAINLRQLEGTAQALINLSAAIEDVLSRQVGIRTKELIKIQHHLESALETEKRASQQQRDFLAMVSHEFRTPLAIVGASTQLLELKIPDDDLLLEEVVKVSNAAERMSALVDAFLTDEWLETCATLFHPNSIQVLSFLHTVINDQKSAYPYHTIEVEGPSDLEIMADAQLLEVAINNLLVNAAKYSPRRSTICLRFYSSGHDVYFHVLDQGPGIPPDETGRIFDRFFRSSNAVGKPGVGLGLHLVRKIASMHKGSVIARNRPEGGTEMILHIVETEQSDFASSSA